MATRAMKIVAAREAKNKFGALIDEARREPITIERNGRRTAVVLSPETYDELVAAQDSAWAARAQEIMASSKPLPAEESARVVEEFLA